LQATDRDLGEALGQEFISLTFRERDKEAVIKMAEALETAFAQDIQTLDWMSPVTKREALAKLNSITNRVGYPEKWQDYSPISISRDDWTANAFRASEFVLTWKLRQIGKPVNRGQWITTPPSTNAYSDPQQNTITVPAGFLAAPLYDGNHGRRAKFRRNRRGDWA
jgi:putative endopeptidase